MKSTQGERMERYKTLRKKEWIVETGDRKKNIMMVMIAQLYMLPVCRDSPAS